MPLRRKHATATTLQRIAKSNPQIDKKLVEESMALVEFMRKMGLEGRGYNILGTSESRLKLKPPVLFKF